MKHKPTKLDQVINELDPTKFKCPICLKYRDSTSSVSIITNDVVCRKCCKNWEMYCSKMSNDCDEITCVDCYKKWKQIEKLRR